MGDDPDRAVRVHDEAQVAQGGDVLGWIAIYCDHIGYDYEHLRSPDFLNAKQYPKIAFKSTSVKKGENNVLEVTGDLTLHGVTRAVTIPVQILGSGQFPPGTPRVGMEANFSVKRAEFDIKGMPGAVGDEIRLIVAVEAAK